MPTILEILNKTTDFFKQKEVDSPKLTAELILAHHLNCQRLDLYLKFQDSLDEATLNPLRNSVKRAANHEPLQYVFGHTHFANCKLITDQRALIPRPETESLVHLLIQKFQETPPSSILDLGTGSGAIGIALATAFPNATVTLSDVSPHALALAQENITLNNLQSRVSTCLSNWFENISSKFDWIISNPPYLTEAEFLSSAPKVKNFEPKLALTPSNDGFSSFTAILQSFQNHLNPNGLLAFETGIHQHPHLQNILQSLNPKELLSLQDLNKLPRFILAQF